MYRKRANPWGVAKSSVYNGDRYHSRAEAEYAMGLDAMLKAKKIRSWKRQVKISLDVNGKHICNYFVDFALEHNDGTLEYLEVKGFQTDIFRFKWRLFEALHGHKKGIKLTIVYV